MRQQAEDIEDSISIGELAELTGISTHTLRVWEKRYGGPKSQRLPSGHRRYPRDDVPRLRAIAKALESGFRASNVVMGTLEELQSLMGAKPFVKPIEDIDSIKRLQTQHRDTVIEGLIKNVHDYNDDDIFNEFHKKWGRDGALSFLVDMACPFMERVGKGWESTELSIANEHFASECLVSFLTEKWRRMNTRKEGVGVLITGLPGEPYTLGLLMCAVTTALTNSRAIYLGNNNPIDEIIESAKTNSPGLIAVSISHAMSTEMSEEMLFKIRKQVSSKTLILTGGKGSPCTVTGVDYIACFEDYYNILIKLNHQI